MKLGTQHCSGQRPHVLDAVGKTLGLRVLDGIPFPHQWEDVDDEAE
ncbi:MAG TPA: hypothetical protein VFN76_10785 [Candidatus Limnocylindria bacterium]|nr:hypothetical protein [Candidatus Limnocylindria bacterium]